MIAFAMAFLVAGLPQDPAETPTGEVSVRGTVVASDGRPLVGVGVLVLPSGAMDSQKFADAEVMTAEDGAFEIRWQRGADASLHVGRSGWGAREIQIKGLAKGRAELDLGRIWMFSGGRQFGRVRDAAGGPVPDVHVIASDVLETTRSFARRTLRPHRCYARTDREGIFVLRSTFGQATSVALTKEGYYRTDLPWTSMDTPMDVVMRRAPSVTGRLIDEQGRGVAGHVTIAYERAPQNAVSTISTDEGGTFTTTLEYPGRYRVYSRHSDGFALSEVFEGEAANVELVVTAPVIARAIGDIETADGGASPGTGEERIRMRVTDASGAAVIGAVATAMWEYSLNRNPRYLLLRAGTLLEQAKEPSDAKGELWVYGPAPNRPKDGAAVIHAPGFAVKILEDLDWEALQERTESRIDVVLEPESVVKGRVVGDDGAPLAHAEVWLEDDLGNRTNLTTQTKPTFRTTRTDQAGSFRVGGLSPGKYLIRVIADDRPEPKPMPTTLEKVGSEASVTVVVPAGHTVSGQVRMPETRDQPLPIHLQLIALPDLQDGRWRSRYRAPHPGLIPPDAVPAAEHGVFEIRGLAPGHFMLEALLPPFERGQRTVRCPVEPMRVSGDIQRNFEIAHALPGRIEGVLRMPLAAIPTARLAVVARELGPRDAILTKLTYRIQTGSVAFVGPDRKFGLRARAGRHAVRVVDTRTTLALTPEILVEVEANRATELLLDVPAVELTVDLGDEAERAVVSRLECRAFPVAMDDAEDALQNVDAAKNSGFDSGGGVRLAPGQTKAKLFVPLGRVGLFPRNNLVRLFPDQKGKLGDALTAEELDVDGSTAEMTIEIDVGPSRR